MGDVGCRFRKFGSVSLGEVGEMAFLGVPTLNEYAAFVASVLTYGFAGNDGGRGADGVLYCSLTPVM